MSVLNPPQNQIWRKRTRGKDMGVWFGWLCLVALTVFCWRVMTQDTIWAFVWDAPRQLQDIVTRMIPPRWAYITQLWGPIWDTLNIATLGTALGILIAVPTAFFAARNTTPSKKIFRPIALFIIVSSRSINSLIWALLLVSIMGPGILAGIIAIGLRSVGFVAKLLYEAIEEVDDSQLEAMTSTGASFLQVIRYAVIPQVAPAFAGIGVFRWDINIRESTVLGLVGAGGIGLNLEASLNTLAWNQVFLILLIIFSMVVFSEWISAKVRQAII